MKQLMMMYGLMTLEMNNKVSFGFRMKLNGHHS